MIRAASFFVLALLAAPSLLANEMRSAAEAAMDRAQVFTDFDRNTAEDVLGTEINTAPPQVDMDASALEEAGRTMAADETSPVGSSYSVIAEHQHDSTFAPSQDALDQADGVELDPEAIVESGTFEASGGLCTITNFESAPQFTRTCDAVRLTNTETCRQEPVVTFTYTVTGVCSDLNEATRCSVFDWEDASCTRSNDAFGIAATCTGTTDPRDFGFRGFTEQGTLSISYALDWETTCSGAVDPSICVQGESICTGGPIAWVSDPVTVTEPCSELSIEFTCPGDTYQNDCEVFEDNPSCQLLGTSCFSVDTDGPCGAYENTYRCGSTETAQGIDAQCENINVCVAGVCDSVEQEPNDEIGEALAGLSLLSSMAEDWNEEDLEAEACIPSDAGVGLNPACFGVTDLDYFSSEVIGCRKAILGTFNCCRDSGWALDVFTSCRDEEYRLAAAMDAERTVYVRSRCSEKVLFVCVEKTREHCTFNGRFAREVSYQGQLQLYGAFECRSLSHAEFEQIDFSGIDLSPLFADAANNVEGLDSAALQERIRSNALLNAPQASQQYE